MANWATEYLLSVQNPDGGWGAYPDRPSLTEPSALASLALGLTPETAAGSQTEAGLDWLSEHQAPSGAWPAGDGVPGASWMTSLATLAVSHFDRTREAALLGAGWLLRQEGRGSEWWVKFLGRFRSETRTVELDPDLKGWPWTEETFSWIEPTAYALLALNRLRPRLPRRLADERIEMGERMIFDRACPGGGWNYGNSRVLGEDLWPYPDTTALALLAVQTKQDAPEVETGLAALMRMLDENRSLLVLSLATLCLEAYGRSSGLLKEAIVNEVEPATAMYETRPIALAALALVEGATPFRAVDDV